MPSQRNIGFFCTAQFRHATGPPNPSADCVLVVVGEVRGHDRMTQGGRSRSSGAAYISLQIARDTFDFLSAPSDDGNRDVGPGVVPSGGMGWPYRSVLGGDQIRAESATESSLLRSFGAPLAFATLSPHAVRDANAPRDDSIGAPLVAATFLPRAVRDANASPLGCVGAPLTSAFRSNVHHSPPDLYEEQLWSSGGR